MKKRVAVLLSIMALVAVAAAAGPYYEVEQFLNPPDALGDCYAIVGYGFTEVLGDGPLRVSGGLYYEDFSLWRWVTEKESGLDLAMALSWDRWKFGVDVYTLMFTEIPTHFLGPTETTIEAEFSAQLDDWNVYAKWAAEYDYIGANWTHVPSIGIRYEWTADPLDE